MTNPVITVTLNPAVDDMLFLEQLEPRTKNIVRQRTSFVGGKGFNMARALAAQGVPVTALGFVGANEQDTFGASLKADGAHPVLVPISYTRHNLKIVETKTGHETELNERGASVTGDQWVSFQKEYAAALLALATTCGASSGTAARWVALTGSVPPGLKPAVYADLIRAARSNAVCSLLDASGEPLRLGLEGIPDAVHVNCHELAELAGVPVDSPAAAARAVQSWLDRGTQSVLVSLGAQGALLVSREGSWQARPPELQAVNAVGAGDTLCAGYLAACLQARPPAEALRWAVALASASVLTPEPARFDSAKARDLCAHTTVEPCRSNFY